MAPDGRIAAPDEWDEAGWFADGVQPGQRGPAVIAGHVDSKAGPAVFFRLADLGVGDEVLVDRADGSRLRFTVTARAQYPKDEFPVDMVYGPEPEPALRLVTCGGSFDGEVSSYRDNIVVFAVLDPE